MTDVVGCPRIRRSIVDLYITVAKRRSLHARGGSGGQRAPDFQSAEHADEQADARQLSPGEWHGIILCTMDVAARERAPLCLRRAAYAYRELTSLFAAALGWALSHCRTLRRAASKIRS